MATIAFGTEHGRGPRQKIAVFDGAFIAANVHSGDVVDVQFPILLAVAGLAALIGTFPAAGETSVCRPWCVIYTGGTLGGATNCGFTSYEQCSWTAQGRGFCAPNGACPPRSDDRSGKRKRRP
jgi:hypothetical protein